MKRTIIGFIFALFAVSIIVLLIATLEILIGVKIPVTYKIAKLGSLEKYEYFMVPAFVAGKNKYGFFNMELLYYAHKKKLHSPCYSPSVPYLKLIEHPSYIYISATYNDGYSWECGSEVIMENYGRNTLREDSSRRRFPVKLIFESSIESIYIEIGISQRLPQLKWSDIEDIVSGSSSGGGSS